MKYEIDKRGEGNYRVCKEGVYDGVRCNSLADAAFLCHALNNLTSAQYIAACEASADACEKRRQNAA